MVEMGDVWQEVSLQVGQECLQKWGALWTVRMATRSQWLGRFKNVLRMYLKRLWDILHGIGTGSHGMGA